MIKLALKDLKLFFSDKRALMLTFALPITLITLFAFTFGGAGGDSESHEYDLMVVDQDSSASSKETIAKLDSLKSLKISNGQLADAQEQVKKGKREAILIFYKGFSDSLENGNALPIELQYDEARAAEVGMLQQALFSNLAMLPFSNAGNLQKNMLKRFDKMMGNNNPMKSGVHSQFDSLYSKISVAMDSKDTLNKSPESKKESGTPAFGFGTDIKMTKLVSKKEDNSPGLVQAVAGTAIMMLLFSVTSMGASLLDEKQEGTLKKLLYSPLRPNDILLGKMLAANVLSISQLAIMFIYAKIVFGLDIFHHLPALIAMIIATAFACSSFGVLLASFARSRQQVQGLSTLVVLIMSCIGGSMIPTFIMPVFMQKISVFSVNYWGIQGFYDIFWRALPFTDLTFLSRILVLLAIGLAMNFTALQLFRKNILKIA